MLLGVRVVKRVRRYVVGFERMQVAVSQRSLACKGVMGAFEDL